MNVLIDTNTPNGISKPFALDRQVTVYAMALQDNDQVHLQLVLMSDLIPPPCVCPPGRVTLPSVIDSVPLSCCGEPIILSREQPYVVLDAPQGSHIRAVLNGGNADADAQRVWWVPTNTPNVTDKLRGCPCEATP